MLIMSTVFGIFFSMMGFTESNIITIYILGVLLSSILTKSHFCSLLSSFCSVLLFNYFFTDPRLTFHAYEPGYSVTFFIMLIAALITGTLAYRLKDNALEAAGATYRTKVLFDTNQLLAQCKTNGEVLKVVANQAVLLLDRNVAIYPVDCQHIQNGYIYFKDDTCIGKSADTIGEEEVIQWVLTNKKGIPQCKMSVSGNIYRWNSLWNNGDLC